MKSEHLFATVLATCALFGASCSSTSTPGTASGGAPAQVGQTGRAGQTGVAGSSSGGAGNASGACTAAANVVPCGGSVLGSWTATPSCLTVSGERNLSAIGLGCLTAPVTGSVQVSGGWVAKADGTYTDQTTTKGQETLTLGAQCLQVSGTTTDCDRVPGFVQALGYEKVSCTPTSAGGCSCVGTVNHQGGVGLLSTDSLTSGNYTLANNAITTGQDALSQQPLQFSYCAANGKMNWSPKLSNPTYTGSIAFESGGVGGAGGSGGTAASGGAPSGGSGGTAGGPSGVGGGTVEMTMPGTLPCDIYENAKTPCVGAFSSVRALYKAYSGPLYQVRSKSDKTSVKDIPLLEAGGYANSKVQDDFCTGGCTISKIYDQSAKKNDLVLTYAVHWLVLSPPTGSGQAVATESNATDSKITVGGHTVYGIESSNGTGAYRVNAKGAAMGDAAEAIYEVADATVTGPACCDDFGNVSTTGLADGEGTMETIFYSKFTGFGHGAGSGPWLMADLEFGVYPSNMANDSSIPSLSIPKFATLLLNGFSGNRYTLKAGDAQMGTLKTTWDGTRPPKYSPMKKGGAFVLGTGGDGSFLGAGVFFEGAITLGCPDDKAVDDAIQASVVAAGYGK